MKLNDRTLIRRVKRKAKKAIGVRFFRKTNEEQYKMIEDIQFITIGLANFLLIDDFNTKEEYIKSINSFLSLEEIAFDYSEPLKYEVGKMDLVCSRIQLKHKLLELN